MADGFNRHYPVFLDLERRPVVIIGEGAGLEKRARQLLRYGADVTVVTPWPGEELLQAEADGLIIVEQRSYVRGDLGGAFLVLCVTEDAEVRRAVYDEAESRGMLANVSGAPEYSNFILPSVINRDPLQVAISTGGVAPELAKMLRKEVGAAISDEWSAWIVLLAEVRALVLEHVTDAEEQERVLDVATGEWTRERLSIGAPLGAEQVIEEALGPGWRERTPEGEDAASRPSGGEGAAGEAADNDEVDE